MNFQIVKATSQDVEILLSFIKELARYEKLEHEVTATHESLKKTLFGENPSAEVIFIEAQNIKVGFALFFHNYSTFLGKAGIYLEDLYVNPEYRGKGFGKALLSYLAQVCLERDCGRLEWSVLDWNTPAIEFYHSLGASPMSGWTTQRVMGEALNQLASLADS